MMAPIPVAVQLLVGDDAWAPLGARGREITGPDTVMVPLGFCLLASYNKLRNTVGCYDERPDHDD